MSPERLKALFKARMDAVTELRALDEKASGREYTAEEKAAEERMQADITRLTSDIERGIDTLEREHRAAESLERYERLTSDRSQAVAPARAWVEQRNVELRELAAGQRKAVEVDLTRELTQVAQSPHRLGYERRDLLTTTANMPLAESFAPQLWEALRDAATVLQAKATPDPTLFITGNGEALEVPRATAHGSAAWIGEGAAITESDPTLSSITLNAWKAAELVQVSSELVEDNRFNLVSYLAGAMGLNCGDLADAAYVAGDGTSKPTGFVPNATVGVTGPTGTSTSLGTQATVGQGFDLLMDLKYSLKAPYRMRGVWMLADTSIAKVAKLKNTEGLYAWQPSVIPGQPDTILGRPVLANQSVPVMAANARSIAFGDFRGYAVRIVGSVRFERSLEFAFNTDLVTYRAIVRTDGKLLDTAAIKVFVNSAT